MPKCRSCGNRVGRKQTYCFTCGTWCPDPSQFTTRVVLMGGIVLGIFGLFSYMVVQQIDSKGTKSTPKLTR